PVPAPLNTEPLACPMHVHQPSQRIRDILAGKGSASSRASPTNILKGVQLPAELVPKEADADASGVLDEEIGGVAMAAQMADIEGLDPRSLEEAKQRPEWPRWQEAMQEELNAL
ncbi:hypothetical protein POSPLADRAFT_1123125, partial [Postia placenta MAD-698-R-SB12]